MKERCIIPCDSITTQSVALKNAVPEIIEKALVACGWDVERTKGGKVDAVQRGYYLNWEQGQGFTIRGMNNTEQAIAGITREYSKQAVSWAASRAGWQVTDTSANQLTVTRR